MEAFSFLSFVLRYCFMSRVHIWHRDEVDIVYIWQQRGVHLSNNHSVSWQLNFGAKYGFLKYLHVRSPYYFWDPGFHGSFSIQFNRKRRVLVASCEMNSDSAKTNPVRNCYNIYGSFTSSLRNFRKRFSRPRWISWIKTVTELSPSHSFIKLIVDLNVEIRMWLKNLGWGG